MAPRPGTRSTVAFRTAPYTSRRVNAEFNWWLLVVGLVVGAGLVWFVLMDSRRREVDIAERERPLEAAWLARRLADEGYDVSPEAAERLLELHREYLDAPPPDEHVPVPLAESVVPEPGGAVSEFPADDRIRVERRAPDIRQ